MARGVNKVILIGNLGADPEFAVLPKTETSVATLSLATSDLRKGKNGEPPTEITEWHIVKFFNAYAETAKNYLRKGSKIFVEGRIQTRKYKTKEGIEKSVTEIMGTALQMLDRKEGQPESLSTERRPQHPDIDDDIDF